MEQQLDLKKVYGVIELSCRGEKLSVVCQNRVKPGTARSQGLRGGRRQPLFGKKRCRLGLERATREQRKMEIGSARG